MSWAGTALIIGLPARHHACCWQRWSIVNSWQWVPDMPLREDAHRYCENRGVQILANLRSLAINALRLDGNWTITKGIAALAHDIKGLLRLLGWRPLEKTPSG